MEKTGAQRSHKGVSVLARAGPHPWMPQARGLECLTHVREGSLQHLTALSATMPRPEVETNPVGKSPGTRPAHPGDGQPLRSKPALKKIPFEKALIASVCQFPWRTRCHRGCFQGTTMMSMNGLQRDAHSEAARHTTGCRPGARITIPINQAPGACQALC